MKYQSRRFRKNTLAAVVAASASVYSLAALTQEGQEQDEAVELENSVTEEAFEDDLGLLPTEPVESVFGFGKTLLDTPRREFN